MKFPSQQLDSSSFHSGPEVTGKHQDSETCPHLTHLGGGSVFIGMSPISLSFQPRALSCEWECPPSPAFGVKDTGLRDTEIILQFSDPILTPFFPIPGFCVVMHFELVLI